MLGGDNELNIWNITNGNLIYTLNNRHTRDILSLCFDSEHHIYINNKDDTQIYIYNYVTGEQLESLKFDCLNILNIFSSR